MLAQEISAGINTTPMQRFADLTLKNSCYFFLAPAVVVSTICHEQIWFLGYM
jgi:hypothetical protein